MKNTEVVNFFLSLFLEWLATKELNSVKYFFFAMKVNRTVVLFRKCQQGLHRHEL